MILDLVEAGKRVGVTAQSHRVIANLLEAVVEARAADERRFVRIGQRIDGEDDARRHVRHRAHRRSPMPSRRASAAGPWDVVGGTSWLWAREEIERHASTSCSSTRPGSCRWPRCAPSRAPPRRVVLLGDPNQLPQVSQGVAPRGRRRVRARAPRRRGEDDPAGPRAPARDDVPPPPGGQRLHLGRVLRGPARDRTRQRAPARRRRAAGGRDRASATCPCARPAPRNRSREEAAWIADAVAALRRPALDRPEGRERPLEVDDVLVVAPYNAQVAEIERVGRRRGSASTPTSGTVDKFQGREAPVAIYSMTTSTPEDAPRDLEFLYSGNRLNVARVARAGARRGRRQPGAAPRRVPHARADAAA